jgi:hypothetical protein
VPDVVLPSFPFKNTKKFLIDTILLFCLTTRMKTRNTLCVSSLRAELRNVSVVSQSFPPKVPRYQNVATQELRTLECGGKRSATPLFANPSIPTSQQTSPIRKASVTPLWNRPSARSFPHPAQTLNLGTSLFLLLETWVISWSLELRHWSFSGSFHFPELSNFQTLNLQTTLPLKAETPLRKTETSHPKLRQFGPLSTSYAHFLLRQTHW